MTSGGPVRLWSDVGVLPLKTSLNHPNACWAFPDLKSHYPEIMWRDRNKPTVCVAIGTSAESLCFNNVCVWLHVLTQVIIEKKEKAIAARAASAPWLSGSSSGVVRDHWLARKQKLTKYRKVQKPARRKERVLQQTKKGNLQLNVPKVWIFFKSWNCWLLKLKISLMSLNVSAAFHVTSQLSLRFKSRITAPETRNRTLWATLFGILGKSCIGFCLFIGDVLIRMLLRVGLRSETPTLSLKEQSQNQGLTIKKRANAESSPSEY